jgi:integral membrane protein (TIGR00529 family)
MARHGESPVMPVTITVLISLLIILLLNKFIGNLFWSVAAATCFLVAANGYSVESIFFTTWERLSSANNIFLAVVVCQIIWLSRQMREAGVMRELVATLRSMVSGANAMAMLPALIGVLPMPGGALFSAPLVGDCDSGNLLPANLKTRVNYWFRHVWEYWWPLYPGVLLAIEITGVPAGTFMLLQLPMSFCAILIGRVFLLRGIDAKLSSGGDPRKSRGGLRKFAMLTLPISAIVAVYAVFRIFAPAVGEFNKYLPIAVSIAFGMATLQFQRPLSWLKWRSILFSASLFKILMLVEVIRVYGAFIESKLPNGTLLATQMHHELASWGVPVVVLIMLNPFLTGVSTGIAIGFVGASFPIVMSLIGNDPTPAYLYGSLVLAYGSGYAGMLFSPVHVCLVVTNEHFKTSLFDSLKRLSAPIAALITLVVLYSSLVKWLLQ